MREREDAGSQFNSREWGLPLGKLIPGAQPDYMAPLRCSTTARVCQISRRSYAIDQDC